MTTTAIKEADSLNIYAATRHIYRVYIFHYVLNAAVILLFYSWMKDVLIEEFREQGRL
jgi:hypothetical protein